MIAPDLDAIEARLKAATPGPWKHVIDAPMFMGTADWVRGPAIDVQGRVYRGWPANHCPQVALDAEFIAHAPEDIAALITHIQQLEAAPREAPASICPTCKGEGVTPDPRFNHWNDCRTCRGSGAVLNHPLATPR